MENRYSPIPFPIPHDTEHSYLSLSHGKISISTKMIKSDDFHVALSSTTPPKNRGIAFTDEQEAIFTSSLVGKVVFEEWNQDEVEQDLGRSFEKFTVIDLFETVSKIISRILTDFFL